MGQTCKLILALSFLRRAPQSTLVGHQVRCSPDGRFAFLKRRKFKGNVRFEKSWKWRWSVLDIFISALGQDPLLGDDPEGTEGFALIINGHSLDHALKKKLERTFLDIGCLCQVRILSKLKKFNHLFMENRAFPLHSATYPSRIIRSAICCQAWLPICCYRQIALHWNSMGNKEGQLSTPLTALSARSPEKSYFKQPFCFLKASGE